LRAEESGRWGFTAYVCAIFSEILFGNQEDLLEESTGNRF
jgi:hypothetical protein